MGFTLFTSSAPAAVCGIIPSLGTYVLRSFRPGGTTASLGLTELSELLECGANLTGSVSTILGWSVCVWLGRLVVWWAW